MATLINLVGTRCKDADHATLLRWYHDHVHVLMRFAALRAATLYRRVLDQASGAPEYICLYEFPSRADFLAFEVSDAREQARQLIQAGWGRDGIEITQRTQYWRLGRRTSDAALAASSAVTTIQSLHLGAGAPDGVARWLSDRVHCALDSAGIGNLAWHRAVAATDAGGEALVMAQTGRADAAGAAPLANDWWHGAQSRDGWGQTPATVAIGWSAPYRRLCGWER